MPEHNLSPEKNNDTEHDAPVFNDRIIVIGASAGGFDALKKIVKGLPPGFNAPIFVVWHISPDVRGIPAQVLNRENTIYAADAYDKEPIRPNRIYIAPPDHHLLVEKGLVRVTNGPKENRFRPAVDPLFRSAAYAYGNRVIGVILSGALDDGTAGLWTVKKLGGTTVVQDPLDAEVPSMPANALREVAVDHKVLAREIAALLVRLSTKKTGEKDEAMKDKNTKEEIDIAAEDKGLVKNVMQFAELSPFTCPECHGVLSKIADGNISRFRCHTGHAYSADTLIAALTESIEDSLYNAIRGIDETVLLLNHIGDHLAEINQPKLAALYFKKAKEAQSRSAVVRKAIANNEQLSKDKLIHEAETGSIKT